MTQIRGNLPTNETRLRGDELLSRLLEAESFPRCHYYKTEQIAATKTRGCSIQSPDIDRINPPAQEQLTPNLTRSWKKSKEKNNLRPPSEYMILRGSFVAPGGITGQSEGEADRAAAQSPVE
ncbi:hypothetical protein Ddc_13954 [Ditylenchus destructor]|nr:hypothetical protein Ddc_13954 [Ditylenchus destructor]